MTLKKVDCPGQVIDGKCNRCGIPIGAGIGHFRFVADIDAKSDSKSITEAWQSIGTFKIPIGDYSNESTVSRLNRIRGNRE